MATTSFQQYKEMGESLGLSGEKLAEYVTKQQSADRAERQARDKEKEREEKRAEREAQEKERERQAQKEER